MRPQRILLYMVLGGVALGVVAALIEEAGHGVALAVAIAGLAALVGSYVSIGVAGVRIAKRIAAGEEDGRERLQRRVPIHMAIVVGGPGLVCAAHPWGMASIAVAAGARVLCQVVYLHATIVAGLILRRRARTAPPA